MRRNKRIMILCFVLLLLISPLQVLAVNAPTPPTGLKATAVSSSQINITWDPVGSAVQYYIYRSNSATGTYTYIGVSNSTSYSNTGLKGNTLYYYKVQSINSDGASDYSTEAWATTPSGSGGAVSIESKRISGNDRYTTAVEIARAGWNTSSYVIIANGENFPDALCASPLAVKYNAPILLTPKNDLHEETKKQLLVLDVKNAIIIGGTGVISEKVANAIRDLGIQVTRLAGADRYETSLKVAEELGGFNEAVIASGLNFQDVLSIAPIAAKQGMPILLTPKDRLSNNLKTLLNRNARITYVLGNVATISDEVYKELPSPQRLTGTNWYSMNVRINEFFKDKLDLSTCYLSTGSDYPDALAGSVLASLTNSPIILVSNSLDGDTSAFFQDHTSVIQNVTAFGGAGAISDKLLETITSKIGTTIESNNLITNLVATPQSSSQIYLTWNSVNNAVTYNVFRSSFYSGEYTKVATTDSPYYTDTYLSTGTTYYYKVQAVYNMGTGPYSNAVSATTLTVSSALMQPTNVNATIQDDNQVKITWDVVSSALFYNVYRATIPNGTYTNLASIKTPYYTDTTVVSGTTYYYKIQAVNNFSSSPYSNIVQAQTLLDSSVISIPTNVSVQALSASQIHVKWDAVLNATFYNVYRATSMEGTYDLVASVNTPYHVDTTLAPGTMYFYKIQAGNSAGVGNFSNIVYAPTQYSHSALGAPSNIKATPLNSSQIFLTWDNVTNATYYNIYRATSSTGIFNLVGTVNTPYFTDDSLTAKTTYYYQVQSGNSLSTGDRSSVISGTTL